MRSKEGKKVPLQLTVHTACSVDEARVAPQLSGCLGRGLHGVLQTSWGVLRYQHHKSKWHGNMVIPQRLIPYFPFFLSDSKADPPNLPEWKLQRCTGVVDTNRLITARALYYYRCFEWDATSIFPPLCQDPEQESLGVRLRR